VLSGGCWWEFLSDPSEKHVYLRVDGGLFRCDTHILDRIIFSPGVVVALAEVLVRPGDATQFDNLELVRRNSRSKPVEMVNTASFPATPWRGGFAAVGPSLNVAKARQILRVHRHRDDIVWFRSLEVCAPDWTCVATQRVDRSASILENLQLDKGTLVEVSMLNDHYYFEL
jgi:hypothetical protein